MKTQEVSMQGLFIIAKMLRKGEVERETETKTNIQTMRLTDLLGQEANAME